MTASDRPTARTSDAFAERLLGAALGTFDLLSVYLGDRLGLYRALMGGAATSSEIARVAGCDERYVREWLEQQAVTGILDVADESVAAKRRYTLPPEHAEVLVDRDSLNYLAPLSRMIASCAAVLPELKEAFGTGGGVSWESYGADMREGQAEINRPMFLKLLAEEWFPAIPALDARLRVDPPARVADIGCGAAWSSIGIARAYPNVHVDAFDLDAPSVEMGKRNVREAGVADRINLVHRDAGDAVLAGQYDLVCVFEAIHDMSRPVDALRTMHRLLAPGGFALVVDENVAEQFTAPGDDIERLMYGWSVFACLANGRAEAPSAATGTVMRPSTLRAYAQEAGFRDIEVLPPQHPFFRFYRLVM